jgi:nucleoid-associated protein YgaU
LPNFHWTENFRQSVQQVRPSTTFPETADLIRVFPNLGGSKPHNCLAGRLTCEPSPLSFQRYPPGLERMNRQLAQILIGATALTGAFFFGSVMQRRHGDLEKTTNAQPMLENEDLVWHSAPEAKSQEATSIAASPPLSVAESTAGQPAASELNSERQPPRPAASEPLGQGPSVSDAKSIPPLERKVVQPDFSRWAESAPVANGAAERPSPMLPLASPPQLLGGPTRPEGELTPQPSALVDPLDSFGAGKGLPETDPWTAPLSSVLLKPPAVSSPQPQPQLQSPPLPADSDVTLNTAKQFAPTDLNSSTRLAATELVPVNQANLRRAEVDTDSFRVHVTRPGDTLQSLSLKYYGKADFYLDIYLANQDQLESPIHLPAGKTLKIPDYGK